MGSSSASASLNWKKEEDGLSQALALLLWPLMRTDLEYTFLKTWNKKGGSLPILPWEGHLYCEQPKLVLICQTLECQTLSHICRSILLLGDGRELIPKEWLLCEPQL